MSGFNFRITYRDVEKQRLGWTEGIQTHSAHHQTLFHYKRAFLLSSKDSCLQTQYRCLFNLGAEYVGAGKTKKGLKCLLRCMKVHKQSGWVDDGDLYLNIGLAYEGLQRLDKALPFLQRAVRSFKPNSPSSLGDALIKLSYCWVSLGERAVAGKSFAQAAKAYRQAGRREDAAMALREAAKHAILSGEASDRRVMELLQGCLEDCKDGGCDVRMRGQLLTDVGLHYCALGQFSRAEACFLEALSACSTQTNEGPQRAVLLQNLGAVKNAQGLFSSSLPYHTEAVQLFGALDQWKGEGESMANLAYAYSQMSLYQPARVCYLTALESLRRAGDLRGQCLTCEGLAATLVCLGATRQAISTYEHTLVLLKGSEAVLDIIRKRIVRKMTTLSIVVAMSQRASHTPIELPLNQPKPSRKTRENSQKYSLEEKWKTPWEEQFSEGSHPPETVGEREEQNTG